MANGKYFYEQAVVLSKTSLVDIVGMQNLTQVVSKITRIHSTWSYLLMQTVPFKAFSLK